MAEKILLIEDDHDIRVSFRQSLEHCGFKVYSAANGRDGLALLNKVKPKLIVLDLHMPIMNGEEFLRIKESSPEIEKIPVIVVTSDSNRKEILTRYPNILKPFEIDNFLEKVTQCLQTQEVAEEN
jgi:CheY-like chemotaxis protein